MKYRDTGGNTKNPISGSNKRGWGRSVEKVKRELEQRTTEKQKESTADRAARRTANATIWMAIFTVILAAVSGGTLWILKNQLREMHEGGIDTHALADATGKMKDSAEKSAQASLDFADTADDINRSIEDAVKKLDAQAVGIEKTRKTSLDDSQAALQTANEAMYLEQRPWVGVEIKSVPVAPNLVQASPGDAVSSFIVVAHNTGKTPAIGWRSQCCEQETRRFDEVIPNYDTLHNDIDRGISEGMRKMIEITGETIEDARASVRYMRDKNDAARFESRVIPPNGFQQVQNMTTIVTNDHQFHYTLGKFVYRDVIDPTKEHVTEFCVISLSGSLQLCRTGNDMK